MTLAAACGWSLARSLLIALAAWPVCRAQTCWLRNLSDRSRRVAWWAIVIPFLCPELWTGYAWSGFGVRLAGMGVWDLLPAGLFASPQSVVDRDAGVDEVLLDLLLFLRAIPVGTLALYFSPPPPLSREALFCWRLRALVVGRASQPDELRHRSELVAPKHSARPPDSSRFIGLNPAWQWIALRVGLGSPTYLALMFLVCFQEFELASLIVRPAWTVWLFDAQVGGLALSESLQKTVLPVLCQLAVLIPLAVLILSNRAQPGTTRHESRRLTRTARVVSWSAVVAAIMLLIVVPVLQVGQETFGGLGRIVHSPTQSRTLLYEIFAGLGYAAMAALVSSMAAAGLLRAARRSRWGAVGACIVSLPGLVGSLALGLVLIRLMQEPLFRFAYKSSLSLGTGLILFLLPRAVLVRCLLQWSARPASEHLARLLGDSPSARVRGTAGDLLWHIRWRGEFWGVGVLAYWGFFDLTTASLLAPVTIVSAPVMLYNQMHFGKNATLSAMVLLTVLVPLAVFSAVAATRRPVFRWFWQ